MADDSVTHDAGVKDFGAQRKTLFVRNLPYTATDKELEDVFSEYGPIKRSFVVKDRDSSKSCRGFGYVVFVMPEDAVKALNAKISIHERKVAVSVADKKPRKRDNYKSKHDESSGGALDESKELEESMTKIHNRDETKRGNQRVNDETEEIKRTIVISGLPSTATKSKLKLLCCKFGKVKKIQLPAPDRDNGTSFVIFKSIKGAVRSFQKINGSKFDNTIIYSYLLAKEDRNPVKKYLDKSKLIIRNIAFKCSEEDLKAAFENFGEITAIDLPSKIDGQGRKRMRGFGFVQFKNVDDAKSAMSKLNKTMIHGRPIIIDWAVPKDEFISKTNESEGECLKEVKEEEPLPKKNKRNAGDKEGVAGQDGNEDDEIEAVDSDNVNGSSSDKEENDGDNDNDDLEENANESEEENSKEADSDAEMEKEITEKAKKKSHDVKEGRTVFVRNLPFETSEEELTDLFSKYGGVVYSKIVVDPETGHSRGSGFVKFKDPAVLEQVISDADSMDPKHDGISMQGRRLVVMKAVTRGKVMEFEKQRKDSRKDPKDKRNLALAQEGVIFPNSEAAKEISDVDMKKRQKSWTEKKAKLKNQNYFISKTRLCIRNLPLAIGENELKMAIVRVAGRKSEIKKVRIMRNKERTDQLGRGRSLGYAFVECESHEYALSTLRALNNNPEVFGDARRPFVEFSVENKVALELQERRREKRAITTSNATSKHDTSHAGGTEEKYKGRMTNKTRSALTIKSGKREAFRKKREIKKTDNLKSGAADNDTKSHNIKNGINRRRRDFRNEANKKENPMKEKRSFSARKLKPPQSRKENFDSKRKRKGDMDGDRHLKAPPKKIKRKGKTDKEEATFNILVSKYKEKLFAGNSNKRANDKRWYE